ncbi:MAG: winged helix-turn-helix transcriptional regulator [Bosea sp. (in: a-proteobacteria)]
MKLEKITQPTPALRKRWYDDACGTAMALELIGERWSLLVVRELMFGGRRFSELRAGMPGVSANVLAERLEGLERVGIVRRRKLPPPASVQVYELTAFGYEAETIVKELGRWAARSPLHDPMLPLSVASIMMSFRTMFSAERAKGETARLGFRFGEDAFVIDVHPRGLSSSRSEPQGCDVVVTTDPMSLASVVYGGRPIADAEAADVVSVLGDRPVFERFANWFPLPAKMG